MVEISVQLTDDDEARGLEELLVVPGGMLRLQDVTHPVVLPQPQRGEHPQTRQQSEHLLTDGHLGLGRDARGVAHPNGGIGHRGRVHLALD